MVLLKKMEFLQNLIYDFKLFPGLDKNLVNSIAW